MVHSLQQSLYMLPGKVFFQGIRLENEQSQQGKYNFKVNLIMNGIYYDELKQFHTKYLCVSASDILSIELFAAESQQLLGTTVITDLYKLILDSKTIQIRTQSSSLPDVVLKLGFQTVSSYAKRRSPLNTKRYQDSDFSKEKEKGKELSRQKERQSHNQTMSPNTNRSLFNQTLAGVNKANLLATANHQIDQQISYEGVEGQSLESLAQQREKILGELFGKFKRQR